MDKQRIIFLDIDGVISSLRNSILNMNYDPVAVLMLRSLQTECNFKIVVSSARRKLHKSKEAFSDSIYYATNIRLNIHDDWRTVSHVKEPFSQLPDNHESILKEYIDSVWYNSVQVKEDTRYWRGHEIRQWLLDHGEHNFDYLVLDDSFDLYPIPTSNVLRIENGESNAGLLVEHYDFIRKYFNVK
jgi:hypothetical protein